jgi:hypothetical protein
MPAAHVRGGRRTAERESGAVGALRCPGSRARATAPLPPSVVPSVVSLGATPWWAWLAALAALGLLGWRLPPALRWFLARARLAATARRTAGWCARWQRPALHRIEGYWIWTELNVVLNCERAGRAFTLTPMTLGVLRDDPPWTWWWVTAQPVAQGRSYCFFCKLRSGWNEASRLSSQRDLLSGDEAFDSRHIAYTYQDDDAEVEARSGGVAAVLLASASVRESIAWVLEHDSDSLNLGTTELSFSARRRTTTLEAAAAQVEKALRLAEAVEHALREPTYR